MISSNDQKSREAAGKVFSIANLHFLVFLRLRQITIDRNELFTSEESFESKYWLKWKDLMETFLQNGRIFHADSLGWSGVLRIKKEIYQIRGEGAPIDKSVSREAWVEADNIMSKRSEMLEVEDDAAEGERFIEKTQKLIHEWIYRQEIDKKYFSEENTKKNIKKSSLMGLSAERLGTGNDKIRSDGQFIGNLYIHRILKHENEMLDGNRQCDRIDSADSGYSDLFVRPLGNHLGVNIYTLSKLKKFIGGDDKKLVDVISRLVVLSCYSPEDTDEDNGSDWQQVDFETETNRVIDELATERIRGDYSSRGIIHLLKLRSGQRDHDQPTWVLRSISVENQSEDKLPDTLKIAIRFIDVSMLIESGAIVKPSQPSDLVSE